MFDQLNTYWTDKFIRRNGAPKHKIGVTREDISIFHTKIFHLQSFGLIICN